jgi:prepilin-type N-terminal cleavage/methylation domain-containing protein
MFIKLRFPMFLHASLRPAVTVQSRLDSVMSRRQQVPDAFSLMELLAVVVILGIIAALIVPRVMRGTDTAKDKACFHNRAEINITVEQFYLHTGTWPANDLSDIGADPNYFPDGLPTCPVSGQPYRLDPTTHRLVGHETSSNHSP